MQSTCPPNLLHPVLRKIVSIPMTRHYPILSIECRLKYLETRSFHYYILPPMIGIFIDNPIVGPHFSVTSV